MRLTIFWRMMFAQMSLIAFIVGVNVYALSRLNHLTHLIAEIAAQDAAGVEVGKRLLRVFLGQMRNAEKYVLLQDHTFYEQFTEGSQEVQNTIEALAAVSSTPHERDLIDRLGTLYDQYRSALTRAFVPNSPWHTVKDEIGGNFTNTINEFIHLREERIARKTSAARDQAAFAATVVSWLTCGGISAAVLLSFISARRVSRPLKRLAQELRLIGKGEFQRHFDIQSPTEVAELARAFNWMALRLAKLDEMKEDFIARISHELRTPLTAIREGTTLLKEEIPGPLSPSQHQIVDVVRHHSERLFHFLSSVLDLSKMEAGMMEYLRVPSDLSALLDRSVQMVHLMAQRKGIRLEVLCPTPLPLLPLDEGRMQQVFDNLLTNAVKFTPEGGLVRVSASLQENTARHDRWVEIRVSDTGIGIPIEEMERIFHKFHQGSQHQQTHHRGAGLGLAIAQHIVVAHGGRIWVESQVGKGSTFVILLPLPDGGQVERQIVAVEERASVPAPLNLRQEGARHVLP